MNQDRDDRLALFTAAALEGILAGGIRLAWPTTTAEQAAISAVKIGTATAAAFAEEISHWPRRGGPGSEV